MKPLNADILNLIAVSKSCHEAFPIKEKMLLEVITQILSRFKSEEGSLYFGGGTSLVCAYDELSKRFSEDADFRFYPKPKTTKKVRKQLVEIMTSLDGFHLIKEPLSSSYVLAFDLQPNDPVVPQNAALRPAIKVEFCFVEHMFYEAQSRSLCSVYNRYSGEGSETSALCVSLEDTAVDKISSFLWHVYSLKDEEPKYDPHDMRHLSDLVYLLQYIQVDDKFKAAFRTTCYSDINKRLKNQVSLEELCSYVVNRLTSEPQHEKDFVQYVEDMSYATDDERVSYNQAVSSFKMLLSNLMSK